MMPNTVAAATPVPECVTDAGRDICPGGAAAAFPRQLPTTLFRVRAWFAARRRIHRVVRELSLHSDRDLADMGLSRSDIPIVARGQFRAP